MGITILCIDLKLRQAPCNPTKGRLAARFKVWAKNTF